MTYDKESANSTSIIIADKYRSLVEQIIAYQNTQQGSNGEFIAEIEMTFSFCTLAEMSNPDHLLVTTQYETFKSVARKLFDDKTLLDFMLAIGFPIVDDDSIIFANCRLQGSARVYFCNDWYIVN